MTDAGDRPIGATSGEEAAAGTAQTVPVNMYETGGALVVVAPMPGVMADDIEVVVVDQRLSISATSRTTAEKDYLLHEWHYGPYERSVDIPTGFGGNGEATFANGQLALRIERGDGPGGTRQVTITQK